METAPLDGTTVLLIFTEGRERVAWWHRPIGHIPGYWEYSSGPIGPEIPLGWRPV
jgi:hypothetical protein